ncbi:MAG: hypothetical protein SGPRY_011797, partial [Prymnesium sp.]
MLWRGMALLLPPSLPLPPPPLPLLPSPLLTSLRANDSRHPISPPHSALPSLPASSLPSSLRSSLLPSLPSSLPPSRAPFARASHLAPLSSWLAASSPPRSGHLHACADPSPSQHTLSLIAAIGERYTSQRAAFSSLYPPAELHLRNAASRTDGYWAFVAKKEEPPPGLTYGEFPLGFFSLLLEQALAAGGKSAEDSVLADLGSGAGRLVLWAAATQAWKLCKGVELLPSLHAAALAKLEQAEGQAGLLLAPVELAEASWDDTSLNLADVDLAFVYTTALPADEQGVLVALTRSLTPQLRRGCLVCTTDYTLGEGFQLLRSIDGPNDGAGGVSTGHIHLKTSLGRAEGDDIGVG